MAPPRPSSGKIATVRGQLPQGWALSSSALSSVVVAAVNAISNASGSIMLRYASACLDLLGGRLREAVRALRAAGSGSG